MPRGQEKAQAPRFAYGGVCLSGYADLGEKTIEGELKEALYYVSGDVPKQDVEILNDMIGLTDVGVSAVGQVVSGQFYIDPPGFIECLDSNLPSQMRIIGYKCVTTTFHARNFCNQRRYLYLIPLLALDLSWHSDKEVVRASSGSE
ncbi:hypothetical protein RJT34_32728 [Clitoria ternatea]|uniref:Uncharacterized protein n=1 Tax=Clitoria ternatea TaxID=43366 RepID=A0AAN9EWJ4_CLITE